MSRLPYALCVVVAIALQSVCPSCLMAAEDEAESWRERFLTEAPRKWAEYRSHSDRFQGSVLTVSSGHVGPVTVNEKNTVEIKQNRALGCALFKSTQSVGATNSQYSFQLTWSSGYKESWFLTWWEPAGTQNKAINTTAHEGVHACVNHGTSIYTGYDQISTLISHPGFKVVRVTPIDKNGSTLAKVDIDFHPESENEVKYSRMRKGWLLFDPQRYWLLMEYEGSAVRDGGAGTTHGSYEYETGAGGLPILKRKLVTFKGKEA